MASLITPQFEQYIAQQTIAKSTVVFDEFVFANIPGLTAENLKNHLTMPQAAHIVHRQAVSQSGVINENAVVYSVTIGTEVGDFDFNFIGLVNKSKNMLAVAIQTTPVKKVRNKNAVQGNSITRNVLLEFRGAKALTNINVTAQTWQIDFTVRLHGIDEKIRLTNRDLYGRAVFFDDSFLVKRKSGNDYTIEPGVAYVEGVRANMTALENINAANLPCSIYLDVVHHCTVTGAYETEIKFLKANKADYTDTTNRPHYVQILADIDSNGVVTDRRLLSPFLGINPLDLDDTTPNKADKRGHTHRLPLASLIKRGIVKLHSGYDSNAEDLAATPKAIKTLKAFIDALTRNLGNYIPNSKKSSRVDSSSADDVATSAAVKSANDNANTRVAKSGDTMDGNLAIDNKSNAWSGIALKNKQGKYLVYEVTPDSESYFGSMIYRDGTGHNINHLRLPKRNGEIALKEDVDGKVSKLGDTMTGPLNLNFGDYSLINQFNLSGKFARIEVTPDDQSNFYKLSYWSNDTELHSALLPKRGQWKVVAYEDWVNNRYVPRTGDTIINGNPTFISNGGFITINSTGVNWASIDYKVWNSPAPLVTTQAEDLGNYSVAFNVFTTPEGQDYNTDRREKTAQIHHNGRIWSKRYGWLDEQFAPANDTHKKSRCHNHWFPSHYAGTEVVDLPVDDTGGIRMTLMNVKVNDYHSPYVDIYLPMAYSGFANAIASDDGSEALSYGTDMIGNNIVRVYCKLSGNIGFRLHVIGWASF
nr:MAG TPA: Tail fiber protein [Caudoviricetes sp.]